MVRSVDRPQAVGYEVVADFVLPIGERVQARLPRAWSRNGRKLIAVTIDNHELTSLI